MAGGRKTGKRQNQSQVSPRGLYMEIAETAVKESWPSSREDQEVPPVARHPRGADPAQ